LNPLKASSTLGNGNLEITSASGGQNTFATFAVSSGKWYWECSASSFMTGINLASASLTDLTTNRAYNSDGEKYSGSSNSGYGSSFTSGDTIGVALDLDNGNLVFYKNGVSQGTAFSSLSGTYSPWLRVGSATTPIFNFGQRPFAYTAPSGYKALCTANLPAPSVTKPSTVMDVKLWTGNGSTQNVTGLSFSPDLVFIHNRTQASNWVWFDTIRGALIRLISNLTNGEASLANSLTSFNSDGFTYGSEGSGNNLNDAFVGYCFDAGTTTSTNTAGSISSQVRANASAGFSIVTWTNPGTANQTIGHGLGVTPSMIIRKYRSNADGWAVYHSSIGQGNYLTLNTTNASTADANVWPGTINSTIFSTGNLGYFPDGWTSVAYCFAPVSGYSSMGSYVGNGSSDGVFVFTGMRPRFLMIKRTDTTNSWVIYDSARGTYNANDYRIYPNLSNAEGANEGAGIDFLSNGFKLRHSDGQSNASGGTYIYAAFAEAPLNYSRAR
jgi:hypothetical protein